MSVDIEHKLIYEHTEPALEGDEDLMPAVTTRIFQSDDRYGHVQVCVDDGESRATISLSPAAILALLKTLPMPFPFVSGEARTHLERVIAAARKDVRLGTKENLPTFPPIAELAYWVAYSDEAQRIEIENAHDAIPDLLVSRSKGEHAANISERILSLRTQHEKHVSEMLAANNILAANMIDVDRRRRAVAMASALSKALTDALSSIDAEIEQRKFGGNDEDWVELQAVSCRGHAALDLWEKELRAAADVAWPAP